MSIFVIEKVRFAKIGSQTSKSVLYVMANYADDDGRGIWPSISTLAEDTELARSTVSKALANMEKDGVINRVGKTHKGTVVYDINLEALAELPQREKKKHQRQPSSEAWETAGVYGNPQNQEGKDVREPDINQSGSRTQTVKEPLITSSTVEQSVQAAKSVSPLLTSELERAVDIYNDVAMQRDWVPFKGASSNKIISPLAECVRRAGGVEGWKLEMQKAGESDYLCGRVPKIRFKNNLTYILNNFGKLLDGGFNKQAKAAPLKPLSSIEKNAVKMGVIVRDVAQQFRVEDWKLRSRKFASQFPEAVRYAFELLREQGFSEAEIKAFMLPQVTT